MAASLPQGSLDEEVATLLADEAGGSSAAAPGTRRRALMAGGLLFATASAAAALAAASSSTRLHAASSLGALLGRSGQLTGCGPGYEEASGSVPGLGEISANGGGRSVGHCGRCADLCDLFETCESYECSPTKKRCELNTQRAPTAGRFEDYQFCTKHPVHLKSVFSLATWNDAAPVKEAKCTGPSHSTAGQCNTFACNKTGHEYYQCFDNTCRHAIKDPQCAAAAAEGRSSYVGQQRDTWCWQDMKVSYCRSASYRDWNEPVADEKAKCEDKDHTSTGGGCDTRQCNKKENSFFMCLDGRCLHGIADPGCVERNHKYPDMQESTWCHNGSKVSYCRSWLGGGQRAAQQGGAPYVVTP